MPKTSAKASDRTREEAASFALAHRTRIEIVSALNARDYSASELASIVRQPLNAVTYHLQELLESGSIEIAAVREVGNVQQKIYRAISTSFFDEEAMEEWSHEQRQAFYSLILQNSGAEAMASLWSGAISDEPKSWLTWAWFNLDEQGWHDLSAVFESTWDQFQTIQAEANERCARSGEESRSYICSLQGYPRSRSAAAER